jgi:hypothetical protein
MWRPSLKYYRKLLGGYRYFPRNKTPILEIRDFGCGLPQAVMDRFQRTGAGSGVGLAGMHERASEGGDFTVSSSEAGTILRSYVPLFVKASESKAGRVAHTQDIQPPERIHERSLNEASTKVSSLNSLMSGMNRTS